jgi:hypothetical protein
VVVVEVSRTRVVVVAKSKPEPEFVYDVPEPGCSRIRRGGPHLAPWLYTDVPAAETEADFVFVAQAEPEPESEPAPEPEPDTPELVARRAKLDLLGLSDPGQGTVSVGAQDTIPYRSSGAAPVARRPRALAARMVTAGIWDASAREVAESGGSIISGSCGLSLRPAPVLPSVRNPQTVRQSPPRRARRRAGFESA